MALDVGQLQVRKRCVLVRIKLVCMQASYGEEMESELGASGRLRLPLVVLVMIGRI